MRYDMKRSGTVIKELRKERGYTQEAFADALNIDRSGVGKIETGDRGCSIDLILTISDVLDVSVDYLLSGHEFVSKKETAALKEDLDVAIAFLREIKNKHCNCG